MREFDLEKAKAGAEVCTRSGKKARIICFDAKVLDYPIIALIEQDKKEVVNTYAENGEFNIDRDRDSDLDLMMAPIKKSGWINIYKNNIPGRIGGAIYTTEEEAKNAVTNRMDIITTTKIEWEE